MQAIAQERNRFAGLDGFALKVFALVVMTMDHLAAYLPAGAGIPAWFHLAGRFAAPLFVFLCAEGIFYTHSRRRYMLRLYIGWVLMTLGNYLVSLYFAHPDGVILTNGMFGTLLLVVLTVSSIESLRAGRRARSAGQTWLGVAGLAYLVASAALQIGIYLGLTSLVDPVTGTLTDSALLPVAQRLAQATSLLLPNLVTVEGSFLFVALGVAFYYLRRWRLAQVGALAALCLIQLFAAPTEWLVDVFIFLTAVPMCLYNGKPGEKRHKSLFYWYYPAHVYAIYVLGYVLMVHLGVGW